MGVSVTSKRSLIEIGTPWSGPRSSPAASSWSARRASRRASSAVTRMNAFSFGLSVWMRSRQASSTETALVLFERTCRAKSSMVKGVTRVGEIVGVAAEAGAAKKLCRLGESLEQRFEFGRAPALCVGDGGFQPVFNSHRLTEIATPSRSAPSR